MSNTLPARTRRAIGWTRVGLFAERVTQAFWPLWSICLAALGALMLDLLGALPLEAAWAATVLTAGAALWALWRGLRMFRWPSRAEAEAQLDATLPGRPISTLRDTLAIGGDDDAAQAVWSAHRARMMTRAAQAQAVTPALRVSRRDPFALRYVAVLLLAVGLLFGSILRVGQVGDLAPGTAQAGFGPSWEGWVEPPRYTGLPTIYLPDITDDVLDVPQGSQITLRLYGEVGALTVDESISARPATAETGEVQVASAAAQSFEVVQDGYLAINGPGGRAWDIAITPDLAPTVEYDRRPLTLSDEPRTPGQFDVTFRAIDDFAVTRGLARITLDLDAVDRRYGLAVPPEERAALTLELPMTISGDRGDFVETLIDDLSEHPWANLPVSMQLEVEDAIGQLGLSEAREQTLPGRRFFDPMAKVVIEARRDLLWSRENSPRITQVLRAVTYDGQDLFRQETSYLRLRAVMNRIETLTPFGMTDDQQAEISKVLWDLAIQLEEGDLNDAAERLRRAQERLQEAIENGATDEEIAELMQELREAMQDYMQQLAESQDPSQQQQQPTNPENMQEMTQQDLQDMLDEIQRLMEEGRMAEAQELLQQLQQMMENMQVTQGQQGGEGQQSEGQQAMEDLAETLREQQGLSDDAFRQLQEQFNPNAQAGDNAQNEGRSGGQGRGQEHTDQGGQQQGQQPGEGAQPGGDQDGQQAQNGPQGGQPGQQPQGGGQGQTQGQNSGEGDLRGDLTQRQRNLRDQLGRLQQGLPGAGTPEGDAAREALGRAGEAMDDAADALGRDDLAEAIDNQADAMEALREGMRNLGDAMQQEQQQAQPGQGNQNGQDQGNANPQQRDPLGRDPNGNGALASDEELGDTQDVYRRAEELLDEIRRRSAEADRPETERDYLRRLLERF
ncbi:MAG: DUF4175 domain-containing protein [Pseudomonadota bacterium]